MPANGDPLALIQRLRDDLLTRSSATVALEEWCETYRLAAPPVIRALVQRDVPAAISVEQCEHLQATPSDTVRLRNVLLTCGKLVLSEACNWYMPGRLEPEMHRLIETTDIPFGKVVASLAFRRRTVSSTLLWSARQTEYLFRNQVILTRGSDHLPFALLVETYRHELLPPE